MPFDRTNLLTRVFLIVAAVALAAGSLIAYHRFATSAGEVDRLLADTGLDRRHPGLAEQIRYDPDPLLARLRVARALVAEALDQSSFSSLPPREAALEAGRIGERLTLAEGIARDATVVRPVTWQAWMLLGAARYLRWSSAGDPRLLGDRNAWQEPLERAHRLAPSESEPIAFLATAGLELWPVLGERERNEVATNLQVALLDPATFHRLLPVWLRVAPDRAAAFARLPDRPETWREVRRIATTNADWELFVAADRRLQDALAHKVEKTLAEAAARVRGGDDAGARELLLGTIAELPADGRFANGFQQLLALTPPGPTSSGWAPSLRRWLQWSTDLLVRGRPGLAPQTVSRLVSMIADLPDAERALADVGAGDLPAAEFLERRSGEVGLEGWAPYCIAKARLLAQRREFAAAWTILRTTHRSWRGTVPELTARYALALASGDDTARLEAEVALTQLAAAGWPATAWRWRSGHAFLDLWTDAATSGFEVTIDVAPTAGSVIQCALDGRSLGDFVAQPGVQIPIGAQLEPGNHLIEIVTVAGGQVAPGDVQLTPKHHPS